MNKFLIMILMALSMTVHASIKEGVEVQVNLSPAGSFKIEATKVIGKIKKTKETFRAKKLKVKVKTFTTGIDLRDKHTKDKLNYKKFPSITILKAVGKDGNGSATIKLMGQKKKIDFKYKELPNNYIEANFSLSLKEFGIEGIQYMGIGVKDLVDIKATLKIN